MIYVLLADNNSALTDINIINLCTDEGSVQHFHGFDKSFCQVNALLLSLYCKNVLKHFKHDKLCF